ncbi:MAG: glycosyltransferase family 39 protein [Elusimicrobiota bacterium]
MNPPGRQQSVPIWLLMAALALPALGLRAPLIEVDDARYAEVPRAMAAGGDWIEPRLNDMPYVEKPPLWYWLGAASIGVLGPDEGAARLPMFLLALLGAAGAWWLGSWLYSPRTASVAVLAMSTAGLWLFLTHNLTLDLPVSVFLLWSTALILRVLEKPEDAPWAAPLAWVAAALAFLSKGLISVMFPALWTAALVVIFPRWRRPALKLLSPTGIAAFVILSVPWLLAVQARRADFLRTFFVEQHFQRYLTPRYGRGAPWWYYAAVLPAGLLPWTLPALAGLARALRHPFADPRSTALAAWVLGVIAFFSTSHSKLATYALPVVPHAALLAAAALELDYPRWAKTASRALGAALLAALGAALVFSGRLPLGEFRPLLGPASLFIAGLALAQLIAPSARAPAAVLGVGGVVAGCMAFAGLRLASPQISAKELALAVRDLARPQDEVWTYDSYLHGLPFYSGRRVDKIVNFVGEFHYAKRESAHAQRFGDDTAVFSLPRAGGKTFVALKTRERAHFETLPAKGSIVSWRVFGPWSLAEIRAR